jgi:hypothetical protein
MAETRSVIVVANQTATAPELIDALTALTGTGPTRFTLVVPGTPGDEERLPPEQRLQEALSELRSHGLQVDGHVGCHDPVIAVSDEWSRGGHHQVIVSTLPLSASKWLPAGLPERVAQATGAPVTHVVATPSAATNPLR